MSKRRKFRNRKTANNPQSTHISGGVNLDANEVTIGGDAIGRDKVSSTQNIDTGGGANISGDVAVEGDSEFVGRDKITVIHQDGLPPSPRDELLKGVPEFARKHRYFGRDPFAGGVNIGGDVVGRDKTVTDIRQLILSPWAWIGGIIILIIGLILVAGIFNIGRLKTLFPQPTPTAFAPATEGQSLIIVADFDDRSGGKYQGIDPAQYIYEQLTAQAKKDNLDVRIERLRHTVDDNTVRPTGETYSATLVLWGWYDALTITPRIERLRARSEYRSTEEEQHVSLTDQTQFEFKITESVPAYTSYVVLFALGMDKYDNFQFELAQTYLSNAISGVSPGSATNPYEAYFVRGNIYARMSNFDQAFVDFNQAIRLKPDYAVAYLNRGNVYSLKGDRERAVADYEQAIQLQPNLAGAYNNRGAEYAAQGKYDQAIADLTQAIKLQPDLVEAYTSRGLLNAYRGDYSSAIADYDQAIRLKPDSAQAYYNRCYAHIAQGAYSQAIADCNRAIRLKPDYAATYTSRGNAYASQREYDQAIADFNQAIELSPDDAGAYNGRGGTYFYLGDLDRAIADLSQAIQLQPDLAEAYNNRGSTYGRLGVYEKAIDDFDRAIQLKPNYAEALVGRGYAYSLSGNADRAIADLTEAIKLKPDYAEAYNNRGIAYYSIGDYGRAIEDYTQSIQIDPGGATAYSNRGLAYVQQGNLALAIADFRKVLELSADPALRQKAQDALKSLGAQ
jgi:tetratricopeptide (TPR) repeat protein